MTESGLVSVVITNYNYAKYVGLAIESACTQTYANIEILVIDDGSKDASREVLRACADKDARVRLFFQENSGQAAATNRGIMEARGEFVAFLDADDIWYPDKLTMQIPLFDDPCVGVAYTGVRLIDMNGVPYETQKRKIVDKNEDFLPHIIRDNFVSFSSSVVRKECFLRAGLLNPQYRVCTDYDLWLRMAKYFKFDGVEEPLIGYRVQPNSLSGNPVEMLRVAREITEIFYKQNSQLLNPDFMRLERIEAYGNRVSILSKTGHFASALGYFGKMLALSPFNRGTATAAVHLLKNVSLGMPELNK